MRMGTNRIQSVIALLLATALVGAMPSTAREPKDEPSTESPGVLAPGKFLVAGRHMVDPHFTETVVLLIRYGVDGALGLVVNRPTDVRLSLVFPEVEGLEKNDGSLYEGGPVAPDSLLMLVHSKRKKDPQDSTRVLDGVFISRSAELLERMLKESGSSKGSKRSRRKMGFRIYAGYAGWAPGQLESELARGDWYVVDADAETVFNESTGETWELLLPRDPLQWASLGQLAGQAWGPFVLRSSASGR